MICNKCNHKLPDDSEFCQYCGNKIAQGFVISTEIIEETFGSTDSDSDTSIPKALDIFDNHNIDDMTYDDVFKAVLESQARETIKVMEANEQNQPNHEGEEDFGLVPEKPIYTLAVDVVDGEKEYLSKLYTVNGEKIKWDRRGSMSVDGINGIVDIYDTYLPSGKPYRTIYINMYGAKKSAKVPSGFTFNNVVNHHAIPKAENPVKIKYCSRCGSVVDNKTKVCTGCGKKYFKGIQFNKYTVSIIVLLLIIIISIIVNVVQYNVIISLKDDIDYLKTVLSEAS